MRTLANPIPALGLAAAMAAPLAAQVAARIPVPIDDVVAAKTPVSIGDPAPVRISTEPYGSCSGGSNRANRLTVRLDATGNDSDGDGIAEPSDPQIVVSGGQPGGLAFLFAGQRRASIPGPLGTVLLVNPDAIVPLGWLDAAGEARLPADLVSRQLVGATVQLQALSVGAPDIEVWLSAGLSVSVAAGNVQPSLSYGGPPSTAVLIAQRSASGSSPVHEVLHRVVAPTTLWNLTESGRDNSGGVTRIYMTLEAPSANEVTMPVLDTRRCLIALGSLAQPVIEIWICQTRRLSISPTVFHLAARIERDF